MPMPMVANVSRFKWLPFKWFKGQHAAMLSYAYNLTWTPSLVSSRGMPPTPDACALLRVIKLSEVATIRPD